jgi:carbon-monoxide dehydrogenase small subunit
MTDLETRPQVDAAAQHRISLTVNGARHELLVEPRRTLADVIRQDLLLSGTHLACEQGVCGACTVVLNGETVRSCIMFAVQADGADIQTIEGVAPSPVELHPVQQAFWEQQGLQCGFCTPGMVLRAMEILRDNPNPTRVEVREGISSNICRCTGYQFIVDAVMSAAAKLSGAEPVVRDGVEPSAVGAGHQPGEPAEREDRP